MTYSNYISLILVCGDCPVTSKREVCWNLLESTPVRIPLIRSSHKWTQMPFIISNSKHGIRIYSQPRIDLNSQSNFYDVLTRPSKYIVQQYLQQEHALKTIYMLVSSFYSKSIYFSPIMFSSLVTQSLVIASQWRWDGPVGLNRALTFIRGLVLTIRDRCLITTR